MPVRVTLDAKNQSGQFAGLIASDRIYYGDPTPENGRSHYYEDDVRSRNEWAVPSTTTFAASWLANLPISPDSHKQTGLSRDNLYRNRSAKIQGNRWIGVDGIPGIQRKQDEPSPPSSEATPLNLEDVPSNDPGTAEYEASESTEAGDVELKIYEEYLASGEEGQGRKGVTIMLRDIPYTMRVEPHVFDLLRNTSDLSHVDYIYLPMNMNRHPNVLRNKGYCFIHFSNIDSAQRFVSRLEHYVLPHPLVPSARMMIAGLAKFQGLSSNLHNVLDIQSKKWRPKSGHAYIRCTGGELASCGLLQLRNLLKRRAAVPTEDKRPGSPGQAQESKNQRRKARRHVDGSACRDPLLLAPLL
jgi:hypothetical protein